MTNKNYLFRAFQLSLLLLLLGGSTVVLSQSPKPNVADTSCDGIDLEKDGFSVRSSKINDPFVFLPWVKARERRAATQISTLIDGKPFLYASVNAGALKIIEDENFLPDTSEARVKLRLLVVRVENCSNKSVDVIYGVYSTQVMPVLSAAPESRVEERQEPEKSSGLVNVDVPDSRPVRFTPAFSYDSTNKLAGGGRFEFTRKGTTGLIGSGSIEGLASSEMQTVTAKLKGSVDDWRWLAHLDWNLHFDYSSLPTSTGKLKGGNLSAQFAGTSRPLGGGEIVVRFGGLVEGGNRQSDLVASRLTSDTVAASPYGAAKLFVGLTSRSKYNSVSGSYGLQLGVAGRALRVDWAKHLADVRHEFWYPIGDHHLLDLESRLTFGKIQTRGKIPLAERFFGGNNEQTFIASDAWEIRANPVIRAIPGSSFFRTPSGDGGDAFFSYNLTAAYAVWRKPLIPSELSKDDEFNGLLQGQLTSAEEFVKLYFLTKDAHFVEAADFIKTPAGNPRLQSALTALSTAVSAAQTSHPGQHANEFKGCDSSLRRATSRATNGEQSKGEKLYSYVASLLSADEDLLTEVNQRCVITLNGPGVLNGDPAIAQAGARVDQIRATMETEFGQIDENAAAQKAKEDMTFARRTINTILYDVNLYSISPVFVFDVARLKANQTAFGGVRYGPGAGLRLELVSAVHFTGGYAWNTRQGPGEAKGTFFFSMGVRDLFR